MITVGDGSNGYPISRIKLHKDWIDLTAAEIKILRRAATNDRQFAELIQAKLRDKNL